MKLYTNKFSKMVNQLLLTVMVKEEKEGGYSVVCSEFNVASQGETFEEAVVNIKEAIELYIEGAEELGSIDEILGQLGLAKKDFKKGEILPRVITANVPIRIAV